MTAILCVKCLHSMLVVRLARQRMMLPCDALLTCCCLRALLLPLFKPCRRRVPAPTHAALVGMLSLLHSLRLLEHNLPAAGN